MVRHPLRPFDAAALTTAAHWFDEGELAAIYRQTASLLTPAGALVVADLIPDISTSHLLGRLTLNRVLARHPKATADGNTWVAFWRAAEREPAFASWFAPVASRPAPRRPRRFLSTAEHRRLLGQAGFVTVVELWRWDASAVLLASGPTPAPTSQLESAERRTNGAV